MPGVQSATQLRDLFDRADPLTVGLEEEVLLLDPGGFGLARGAVAEAVLSRLSDPIRFKPELPTGQLEIATRPHRTASEALAELAAGRRELAEACADAALPVCAPVHPFAATQTELNADPRYAGIEQRYASVARRQLVSSLQIHVVVGGAERALVVYNRLRLLLPELAALAANAPYYAGQDTGLASVRPTIAGQLPRQGIPPPLADWESLAAELEWGARSRTLPDRSAWWWELRPHHVHGTLEVRVPDVQVTVAEAAGVVALVHALVATLAAEADAGERAPAVPSWRIEENRWAALRYGVEGKLADLVTGRPRPARERLAELVDWVEPAARALGGAELLACTRALIEENGAIRQRRVGAEAGVAGVLHWMAGRFLEPFGG